MHRNIIQHRVRMPLLPATILGLALSGCGGGPAGTPAATELPGGAVTLWTDSTELFMEHPALIVGQAGKFAVHLTDLTDFTPLTSGRIVLLFEPEDGGEGFSVVQEAPRSPGIYGPAPAFPRAGLWNLTIRVESPQARDVIAVPGLRVYATEAEVPAQADGGGGGIAFLKEQQWKIPDFRTAFAAEGSVTESFDATGTVVPAAGRLAHVAAPIAGLVTAAGVTDAPIPGQRVARGQLLVTLLPSLGEGGSAWAQARGRLREAEAEWSRAERLYAVEAIPERRLREAENQLQVAREALGGLAGGGITPDGGLPVLAPIAGVVTRRSVAPGSRVDAGAELFTIVDPSVVWLQANVPAASAASIGPASGASFQVEGSSRFHEAPRTVSVGSMLDSLSRTVPVVYQAANADGSLKIGANARVAIRTGRRSSGLVIPATAVLDEDGRAVVYVQVEGESFEKREVRLGGQERGLVLVLGGLNPGERVVTGAAYQVRLASLSTSAPTHGHEH